MGNADDEIITNGDVSSPENGNDSETADFVNVEKDKISENGDLLKEVNLEVSFIEDSRHRRECVNFLTTVSILFQDQDVNSTNEAVNIQNENVE